MKQIYCLWQERENIPVLWFATKDAAEAAARMLYPNETIEVRYSRIYERNLLTLKDLHGENK
jgi:hypothetical protein